MPLNTPTGRDNLPNEVGRPRRLPQGAGPSSDEQPHCYLRPPTEAALVALPFRVSLRSMSWDTFLFRASIVWLLILVAGMLFIFTS
jgi:hypothetical protein